MGDTTETPETEGTPPEAAATPPSETRDPSPNKDKGALDALRSERESRKSLEREVKDLQAAHQTQMDAFAKALGLKDEETAPDPVKLAEQVAAAQSVAAVANRDLAVFKAAPALEANAVRLLDSTSFKESIKDIDPSDGAALAAAIKVAVEADPIFKANPTPPTPPFNGGPRTPASTRAGSLGEAITNKIAAQRS